MWVPPSGFLNESRCFRRFQYLEFTVEENEPTERYNFTEKVTEEAARNLRYHESTPDGVKYGGGKFVTTFLSIEPN